MTRPLLAALLLLAIPAAAHVTVEPREAPANAFVRLAFAVPHGCRGAPTVAIEVSLPEGVPVARPMPKPGWEIAVETRALERPVPTAHGLLREAPATVAWRGGPLADAHYDEFVLLVRTPDRAGEALAFPVVQRCAEGRAHAWTAVGDPAAREPAPLLRLAPR